MNILILIISFICAFTIALGVLLLLTEDKQNIMMRLLKYTQEYDQFFIPSSVKVRKVKRLRDIIGILGKVFKSYSFTKNIEKELYKAEIPMKGEEYIVLNIFMMIMTGVITFIIWTNIICAISFSLISILIPKLIVSRIKRKRFDRLNLQINECLTVISNSLRAGYSFQQAIDMVSKEMSGPLAIEFRRTLREINLGTTTDEALLNLSSRVESDDLGLVITAVMIQRQIGGNLAEILDNISYTIRERIRIKGEIKTLTAQGRISGIIIGLLPPALFAVLMLINPSYIKILLGNRMGWLILGSGVVSEMIGALLIKKIVDIEM